MRKGVMLTIIKVFIILFYSRERKALFEMCKKGGRIMWLPSRVLGCYTRWKRLSFCKIWNNPTPPLFFIRPPYKWTLQGMEIYDIFMDRFQDISKVKNPAISREKAGPSKTNILGGIWHCHIDHVLLESSS